MDLEKVKVFYMVAKTGKFTKAASALNLTQPALTRSIQLLEYSLKTKLFDRSHQGVLLTSSGERLYDFAKRFLDEAEMVKREISDYSDEPAGELKILTTPGMASIWLCNLIPGFLKLYPDIRLDIYGAVFDLEKNFSQADVVIRTYMSHHTHLIQRQILASQYKLWASEAYLNDFGVPNKVADLDHHRLLVYEKSDFSALANNYWILEQGTDTNGARKPYLVINSLEGLIACARNGLGIIALPDDLINIRNTDNKLVQILQKVDGPIVDIYCIYSEKLNKSKKVNLFVDYLEGIVKAGRT
jgi:DNA-binding transcriptional LysR family regulator